MKDVLKNIWVNHKKKLIALVIMILSAIGVLNDDVKQAIHEATAPKVEAVVAPAVAPAAVVAPEKVEEKK